MIFVCQIYPFGNKELVKRIKVKLGMLVDISRAIQDGIVDRFIKWHEKQKNSVNLKSHSHSTICKSLYFKELLFPV